MRIEAKIKWVKDNEILCVQVDDEDAVMVDEDHVSGDREAVAEWVLNEMQDRTGTCLAISWDEGDNGDFVITNIDDVVNAIKFEEWARKMAY